MNSLVLRLAALSTLAAACGTPTQRTPERVGGTTIGTECNGRDVHGTVALDLDIRGSRIQGAISVNGTPLADGLSRGSLVFVHRTTAARAMYELGSSGATYAITLPPGHYDVYLHRTATCAPGGTGALPCGDAIVAADLDASSSGMRDIAIRTAHVHGSVSANGQAGTVNAGQLQFVPSPAIEGFQAPAVDVQSNGTYDAVVGVGTHTIHWFPPVIACTSTSAAVPGPIPCVAGPTGMERRIDADAQVDVDLQTAVLSGTFQLDGQAPGSVFGSSVSLALEGALQPTRVLIDAPSFHVRALRGTYAVSLTAPAALNGCDPMGPWPCGAMILETSLPIANDTTQMWNIQTARIRGSFTVNGQAPQPTMMGPRGVIQFRTALSSASETSRLGVYQVTIPSAGDATFDLRVQRGTYDVIWQPSQFNCDNSLTTPCTGGTIAAGESYQADVNHNYDVRSVPVTIDVRLGNNPLPEGVGRGSVTLIGTEANGVGNIDLPSTGASTITTSVLPGHYRVLYQGARSSSCESILCGTALLRNDLGVSDAPVMSTVTLETATLSGRLTFNGQPWQPRAMTDQLYFFDIDGASASAVMLSASAFLHTVGAGRQVIVYAPSVGCNASSPADQLCASEVLAGCP